MGYKLLGFVVWQVMRLYVRRRFPGARRAAAVTGAGLAVAAAGTGIAVAGRQRGEKS